MIASKFKSRRRCLCPTMGGEFDMGQIRADYNPYMMYVDPYTKTKLVAAQKHAVEIGDRIAGKWNYYQKSRKPYPLTEAGFNKAAQDISADMIKEGFGASVADIQKTLARQNYWAAWWEKVGDPAKKIADAIKWSLIAAGVAVGSVVAWKAYKVVR